MTHTPRILLALSALAFLAATARAQTAPSPEASPLAAAFPQTAPAPVIPPEQQATRPQIEQLFALMNVRAQVDSIRKMFPLLMQQELEEQRKEMEARATSGVQVTPQLQTQIDQLMTSYMEKAQNFYPVDAMLDDMAGIYQRHFTRSDVDAYIAFYQSPAGQHLLNQQPAIMQEYMPVVLHRVHQHEQDLRDNLLQQLTDLLKSCGQCRQPSPPSPR